MRSSSLRSSGGKCSSFGTSVALPKAMSPAIARDGVTVPCYSDPREYGYSGSLHRSGADPHLRLLSTRTQGPARHGSNPARQLGAFASSGWFKQGLHQPSGMYNL